MADAKLATTDQSKPTLKQFLSKEEVKGKFQELLKDKAPTFIASLLQVSGSSTALKNADPTSIMNAALMAATLDLPINQNLGFAWIIAYGDKAQFQMGWRGYVQLAQRTAQYVRINVIEVHKNQFTSWNSLTEELVGDFSIDGDGDIVGYCGYFKLINGMEKTVYWSKAKVTAHGKRFSKSFASGPWRDLFDEMAKKTVLKNMLSKWGILSIEMQKAIQADQAVIKETEDGEFEYVDNQPDEKADPQEVNAELRVLLQEKVDAKLVPDDKKGRYIDILENEEVSSYAKMKKELEALK